MTPHAAMQFWENLCGEWDLTGAMGSTALHQRVSVGPALNGMFIEMRIRDIAAAGAPYQAAYFIGYDEVDATYVMHLLDTFGAHSSRVLGLGTRSGDAITFTFAYEGTPFCNRFEWDAAGKTWTSIITFEKDGETQTFATKRMTRIA